MVHVEVDDGRALDAMLFLRVAGSDGRVVEKAKSHGTRGLGVVARWARGDECVRHLARHHFIDRVHGAAGRAQSSLKASGRHGGIGIEPDHALFWRRVAHRGDIVHGVAERDRFERRCRRLDAHKVPEPLVRKRALDRAQPIGALGMACRGEVLETGGMGDEKGRHNAYPGNGSMFNLSPAMLTPGGGPASSGTKKVDASGSPASTRYFSKSVTPSAARKVSSIRK